jgi:2-hydroxy-6-oxonona-2,4-dienedioate hydrolase
MNFTNMRNDVFLMASNNWWDVLPERYTIIDGCKIRYLDYNRHDNKSDAINTFPILLLLHGIGASYKRWIKVAPELSKYFRVIVPDIIGFGYSCKPRADYTIDFFIEFLVKFLKNLNIIVDNNHNDSNGGGNNKIIIVGSSFGGLLAAEFASRYGNLIEKLVLVSPVGTSMLAPTPEFNKYRYAALFPTYDNALNALRTMVYDPSIITKEMVEDFVKRMHLENARFAFRSTLDAIRDNRNLPQRLSKISTPTQVVWGRNDRIIPYKYQVLEYMEIPDIRINIINECGHLPPLEKPSKFIEIIIDFCGVDDSE